MQSRTGYVKQPTMPPCEMTCEMARGSTLCKLKTETCPPQPFLSTIYAECRGRFEKMNLINRIIHSNSGNNRLAPTNRLSAFMVSPSSRNDHHIHIDTCFSSMVRTQAYSDGWQRSLPTGIGQGLPPLCTDHRSLGFDTDASCATGELSPSRRGPSNGILERWRRCFVALESPRRHVPIPPPCLSSPLFVTSLAWGW